MQEQIRGKIPLPKHDIGHGWAQNEVQIVSECLEEMAREEAENGGGRAGAFKALAGAKAMKDSIIYRLKEELGVEKSVEEVDQVARLIRLYDELKQLEACRVSASGEEHQDGDSIALVLLSPSPSSPNVSPSLNIGGKGTGNKWQSHAQKAGNGRRLLRRHADHVNASDSSASSEGEQEEGSDDSGEAEAEADEDMVHTVLRRRVPPGMYPSTVSKET